MWEVTAIIYILNTWQAVRQRLKLVKFTQDSRDPNTLWGRRPLYTCKNKCMMVSSCIMLQDVPDIFFQPCTFTTLFCLCTHVMHLFTMCWLSLIPLNMYMFGNKEKMLNVEFLVNHLSTLEWPVVLKDPNRIDFPRKQKFVLKMRTWYSQTLKKHRFSDCPFNPLIPCEKARQSCCSDQSGSKSYSTFPPPSLYSCVSTVVLSLWQLVVL